MRRDKKQSLLFTWVLIAGISLSLIQFIWIYHTYHLEYSKLLTELKDAFSTAYEKEQTYRVPVVDIVNPGEVSIQSCGSEEIIIVRKCLNGDTIVYSNTSGYSIENFITHVFWDLRENISPMNIYCLSDLFGGMLHDKDIPLSFVIERYNINTGTILETSAMADNPQVEMKRENTIVSQISETEVVRAVVQITPKAIIRNMSGILLFTFCLAVILLVGLIALYRKAKENPSTEITDNHIQPIQNNTFHIGQYTFNPSKNELEGFGETIQLNKKENTILYALCTEMGNVVERNYLLTENWGDSGEIYSRSLDTYLTTLRKYLKKDPDVQIITIKGVGYKLVCNKHE